MDRNAPISIVTAIVICVVGVFALMIMPIFSGIYELAPGYTGEQGGKVMIAEVAGGALASILAMFWITKFNWRTAVTFALLCVVVGNAMVAFQFTIIPVEYLRLLVGFFGQGTAFVVGVAIIGNTSDPDRNFGFVITTQVLFGVVALASFPFLVGQFNSIGGMYVPLGGVALIGLLFVKHIPEGPAQQEMAGGDSATGSLALPVTALVVMLIWCCGLGAMWGALGDIAIAGGLELEIVGVSVSISSAVAMTGSLAAATLAAKGVNRFLPMTIALLVQIAMAWLLQGEMSFPELVIKASIFQIFWNMTGPFLMGAIAASDTSGRVSVLIPAAQTTGFFVGPVAVAIASGIFAEAGLVVANYLTVLFCAIALIIFIPLSARLKAAGY